MEYLISLALGIAGSLIAAEIVFHHKAWCRWIIKAAARRIDDPVHSEIKHEEWLAALDEHVGVLSSIAHAVGCWIGAPAVAAELKLPATRKLQGDPGQPTPRIHVSADIRKHPQRLAIAREVSDQMLKQIREMWLDTSETSDRITDFVEQFLLRERWRLYTAILLSTSGSVGSLVTLFFFH